MQAEGTDDLRTRLLNTSRALLTERGPAALSMREVARRTGCTHQAPYHYFPNREAILAAVVAEGFSELADALEYANTQVSSLGAHSAAIASANAYVTFAIRNPGVFQVMFRNDMIDHSHYPDVQRHGDRARTALRDLVRLIDSDHADHEQETVLWSHVHGLASLLTSGLLGTEMPSESARIAYAERINTRCIDILLR